VPLYEYECRRCHHRFERIRKFSDPPLRKCPNCRGGIRKLVSAPGIHFKGSGWYITDYGHKKGARDDSKSKEGEAKGSGADGGTDAKAKQAPKKDSSKDSSKDSAGKSKKN
jgi:putative FmdB family regulatory protein